MHAFLFDHMVQYMKTILVHPKWLFGISKAYQHLHDNFFAIIFRSDGKNATILNINKITMVQIQYYNQKIHAGTAPSKGTNLASYISTKALKTAPYLMHIQHFQFTFCVHQHYFRQLQDTSNFDRQLNILNRQII